MPAKIIDQYTDRTDLSRKQKWILRNPERAREVARTTQLKWVDEHQGKIQEYDKKYRNKARLERLNRRNSGEANQIRLGSRIGQIKSKEILNLHSRGKDVGRIAVWMNLPVSCIMAVIEENKTKGKEQG